ncbi:MAG: IS200/IS605 family transposase [Moorea sp. SIO1F2]|uniref:IS200/IS605 family transposase n=1 Tax=Moorena sp. SIO1F2 TaxID=2607819 RepID=UPI0013BAA1A7|nr:IS200/IS605 family transposase [Moorena sp. SIO1F2]NEO03962.1 IS200/IS605 family transposase [Moorena sp. SIO3I7]NET86395.1 IS200/IS605 family transposase [Moorena sp. SIO1F2]
MPEITMRKGSHVVFSIHLHIVFVTKYRRQVFTKMMLDRMAQVFTRVLEPNKCKLEEFNGEPDHVHLMVSFHPDNNLSDLIASLKSASSRILRKEFKAEISKHYWGEKAKLWHDSKCIVSCGGAPLDQVKQYIENQSGGRI